MIRVLCASLLSLGCASGAPAATVLDHAPDARPISADQTQAHYCVDVARSSFAAVARAMGVRYRVKVSDFRGGASIVDGQPSSLWVVANLKTAAADTELVTGLLRSRRFLFVERYPEARFVSVRVRAVPQGHEVTGLLTLRGKTQTIVISGSHRIEDGNVAAKARFSLERGAFDIRPGAPYEWLLADRIDVELDLVAMPCEPESATPI